MVATIPLMRMSKGNLSRNKMRHRWIETLLNENGSNAVANNSSEATQPPIPLSSTSSSSHTSASLTALGSLIIIGLFIILGLSIWYITWWTLRYYRQRKLHRDILLMRAAHLSGTSGHDINNEENQPWYVDDTPAIERIQRRYETIEHWTITKRAQEHTTCCSTIQAQRCSISNNNFGGGVTTVEAAPCISSIITDEEMNYDNFELAGTDAEGDHECPICMSKLEAGQVLSWSSNPKCIHVYHHECIKEWLLRHKECCMCKQIYLPIDAKNKQPSPIDKNGTLPKYINELSQQFRASVATSYYCVEHGLVRIPELFYCTQSELEQLEHQIIDNTISPIDLVPFRGNYHEYENTITHQPMESFPTNSVHAVPGIHDTAQEQDATIQTTVEPVVEAVAASNVDLTSIMETEDTSHSDRNNDKMETHIDSLNPVSQLQQKSSQCDTTMNTTDSEGNENCNNETAVENIVPHVKDEHL